MRAAALGCVGLHWHFACHDVFAVADLFVPLSLAVAFVVLGEFVVGALVVVAGRGVKTDFLLLVGSFTLAVEEVER